MRGRRRWGEEALFHLNGSGLPLKENILLGRALPRLLRERFLCSECCLLFYRTAHVGYTNGLVSKRHAPPHTTKYLALCWSGPVGAVGVLLVAVRQARRKEAVLEHFRVEMLPDLARTSRKTAGSNGRPIRVRGRGQ